MYNNFQNQNGMMQQPQNPMSMMIQQLLQQRPDIQNNPGQMAMVNALLSGDSQRGMELANQFCQQCNMTPDQMMQQAVPFLQQMGFRF